jgi:tRNA pseudouridine38-40 synthase
LIIYTITASSFLWKMVRGLIGTFLSLDEAGQGAEEFRRILEARSRFEAGATAPSQGLFLEKVEYEER